MALSASIAGITRPDSYSEYSYSSNHESDWVWVCSAPETVESGSAVVGGKVVRPGSITRSEQRLFLPNNKGDYLLACLKYDVGLTGITNPVVRVFGRDGNDLWQLLEDEGGGVEHTLTTNTADVRDNDGLFRYTSPIEVLLAGSQEVIVAVQTALAGTGTVNNSEILAKTR